MFTALSYDSKSFVNAALAETKAHCSLKIILEETNNFLLSFRMQWGISGEIQAMPEISRSNLWLHSKWQCKKVGLLFAAGRGGR
jgi:hypothetical protein